MTRPPDPEAAGAPAPGSQAVVILGVAGEPALQQLFAAPCAMCRQDSLTVPAIGVAASTRTSVQRRQRALAEQSGVEDRGALRETAGGLCDAVQNIQRISHPQQAPRGHAGLRFAGIATRARSVPTCDVTWTLRAARCKRHVPLTGVCVRTAAGRFAARPFRTEPLSKTAAEHWCGAAQSQRLIQEAHAARAGGAA